MRSERSVDGMSGVAKRIVVPLDGSPIAEQALPYARAIAAPDAELVLVQVVPAAGPSGAGPEGDGNQAGRRGWLTATAARLREASGLRVDTLLDHGDPATAILRAAREGGADVVVLASEGWREPAKRYQGSVGDRVAREAATSVLIVPARARDGPEEGAAARIRRVIVPLDGSVGAMGVLPVAEILAGRSAAPVWLIAAVDPAYWTPSAPVADAERASRDALAELRGDAQRMLEGVGARIMREGGSASWRVLDGPAADAIVGAAREGDLIVLASRGRSGAGGWPIGSVAEKVVRYSPVPVLVHRAAPG